MIEQCLYKNPNGRYLDIRQDRIQLCGYDRCAAALMNVFATWTSWRIQELERTGKRGTPPWLFLSKRQLRYDLLGVFGEPSIERGIGVIGGLGLLRTRRPEKVCGAIWYLFDYAKANEMLKEIVEETSLEIKKHPNRRNGWLAQRGCLGNNAEADIYLSEQDFVALFGNNAEEGLGIIAESASAIMPTNRNLNQGQSEIGTNNTIPFPEPTTENQNPPQETASPTLDSEEIDSETGELYTQSKTRFAAKRSWKRPKEQKPSPVADRLRAMRDPGFSRGADSPTAAAEPRTYSTAQNGSVPLKSPLIDFPARWNELVPERPVDPSLLGTNPKAYQHPVFVNRFDEICQKAKFLISGGNALVNFGYLLKSWDGRFNFQAVLANELDYTVAPKSNGKPPLPDGKAIAAKMRAERLERERIEREATGRD